MIKMNAVVTALTLEIVLALLIASVAPAQTAPPPSDIFLIDLKATAGKLGFGKPANITDRVGYDNQPSFLPDGNSILFTSIREDRQADIYRYDIASGATTQLTRTKESEYSPTLMPDGKHFSVVRVEADSTQRLWKFPLAGGDSSLVLESVKPVGYHVWVDTSTVVVFVLGEPSTLQIADLRTGRADKVIENVGRSLQRRPDAEAISFVHRVSQTEWTIKQIDVHSRKITPLINTLPGQEHYAWAPDGSMLSAVDSKLFRWIPGKSASWEAIADFSRFDLKGITRIAISPRGDRLALVASGR